VSSPGTLSPGTLSPGALSPGALSPGTLSPGTLSPGALSPGALSPDEIEASASWLASCQLPSGMVPWYEGGHADPWNHTEVAMALAAGGRTTEAERAFDWLARQQLRDGSWCTFYLPDGVEDARRDPNACAYVATGVWWCQLLAGLPAMAADPPTFAAHPPSLVSRMWPIVERAVAWCLQYQQAGGKVSWSVSPDGVPGGFALLAANASLSQSLKAAAMVARATGRERPRWSKAASRVAEAVAGRPDSFAPKRRWAMDWYYPVLAGAIEAPHARPHLRSRWEEFVMDGLGTRCVSGRDWVTAAETAECAMAANRAGLRAEAEALLTWTRHLRDPRDGAYWTGCVHPECVKYPRGQKSTYSTAAVLIADHVLYGRSPAAQVFGGSARSALRMDQLDQAGQLPRVGAGQDPVTQVEDVPFSPSRG
jgi:hypothetical protein